MSKNAAEKKKMTRIDASSKVITIEKWIGTEKIKIEYEEVNQRQMNLNHLTSAVNECKQQTETKQKRMRKQIMTL